MIRVPFRLIALAAIASLGLITPAFAQTVSAPLQSATVAITDQGFSPANVVVWAGGTVTWTNQGQSVHTATATNDPKVPAFNTGGLGNGQTNTVYLATPGAYPYSSSTDCLKGNTSIVFSCGGPYTITVVSTTPTTTAVGTPVPGAPVSTPVPSVPPGTGPMQDMANVIITDSGFTPRNVALTLNGTITFVNQGTTIHSATSRTAPALFDTGGLTPGQSKSVQLVMAGNYTFWSATDCGGGNNNPMFDCSDYTVVVSAAPVGATSPATPNIGQQFIYIRDDTGFDPPVDTVQVGTTVTWLNLGLNAHTVTDDSALPVPFDSGGLGTGNIFSVTFNAPGTYTYHSSADPTAFDQNRQPTAFRFSGQIVVQ